MITETQSDSDQNDLEEIVHDPEGDVYELSLDDKQQCLVPIDIHFYKDKFWCAVVAKDKRQIKMLPYMVDPYPET